MTKQDQYDRRYWDKQAYRYDKRALNKNSPHYKAYLQHVINTVEDGARLVDLGCGTGLICHAVSDKIKTGTGIDISSGMISMARAKQTQDKGKNLEFIKGDIYHSGLENHTADNTLLCNILEYSQYPEILLLESKRITRPNGLVITATNCYGSLRDIRGIFRSIRIFVARTFKMIPYVRFYTFKNLRRMLETSGMVIIAEKKLKHMGTVVLYAVLKT